MVYSMLGIEPKAVCVWGEHSTNWVTPPVLSYLIYYPSRRGLLPHTTGWITEPHRSLRIKSRMSLGLPEYPLTEGDWDVLLNVTSPVSLSKKTLGLGVLEFPVLSKEGQWQNSSTLGIFWASKGKTEDQTGQTKIEPITTEKLRIIRVK